MQTVQRLFSFFEPKHYALELDLRREERVFSGTVVITGRKTGGYEMMLHAKELNITSVTVDDSVVEFERHGDELTITPDFPAGDYTLTLVFDGKITDAMHGLYPCYFELDGVKKELLATQFESHHAREVFPCIDEPEAKATFDLTLTTEAGVEVLSNMPLDRRSTVDDGRWKTAFQTTPRMSPYLLAFVVGELQKKSAVSTHGVEVNVWSTKAQTMTSLEYALGVATRAVDFYDEYFGVPYPLSKADHVAIPDFSAAAMENWGLIVYRESALLAEPSAAQETKKYIASVVSHELSHQWFGNLVTMRWWNNLWLNESFAALMEYVCVDTLEPDWHAWDDMTMNESVQALRRDAIDGVQAVQTEVHHPDEINSLFDTAIVYAKGARLMRMLLEYVGHDAFRAGLKAYFTEHAYANTEADDLWRAMSEASSKDVATLMNAWIAQPGYPVVTLEASGITQQRFFIGKHSEDQTLWPIPLFHDGSVIPEIFDTKSYEVYFLDYPIFNMGDRAHFITNYGSSGYLWSYMMEVGPNSIAAVDRIRLLHEQSLLVEAELADADGLLRVLPLYSEANEEPVWAMVVQVAKSLRLFVEGNDTALKKLGKVYSELVKKPYERLGWRPKQGESTSDAEIRADILSLIIHCHDQTYTDEAGAVFNETPLEAIDANIRVSVLRAVLERQHDDQLFDTLFDKYKTTKSPELKHNLMYSLPFVATEHARQTIFAALTDSSVIRPQDLRLWLMLLLQTPWNRYETWRWLVDTWSWIDKTFASDKSYERLLQYCGNYLSTRKELDEFTEFIKDKRDLPALARTIDIAEKQIAARVSMLEHQSKKFISALNEEFSA